jgi:hypothetical protein
MSDRIDKLVAQLAAPFVPASGPLRKCSSSSSTHLRISKLRADHDRVSKAELERELFLSGVASIGEQSKAARLIGVTEGALRHWRDTSMTKCLPPRWALEELRRKRQEASQSRRHTG